MYIKTEEVSACDFCWYSRACRWRNELSVWCERGNTVARRFGWHDICVLWSDWTGTWHLDLWILKYLQNKYSVEDWCKCRSSIKSFMLCWFFFLHKKALCKRTLNVVEALSNAGHGGRMRFYLSKADEAGHESDR